MEKLPRNSSDDERGALKSATRHALKVANGKRFSLVTRVLPPALSDYGSTSAPEFMPVDIVLDLQREFPAGVASPLLTELAALCGFKLVPLDDDGGETALDVDDVGAMMKEGGEANTSALRAATSPTCLTSIRTAKKEIFESIEAKSVALRKLTGQERRLLSRAG